MTSEERQNTGQVSPSAKRFRIASCEAGVPALPLIDAGQFGEN
jgi:hypothetical protein